MAEDEVWRSKSAQHRGFAIMRTMTNRSMAVLLLLLVLVAFPVIVVLPNQVAVIRLAGLSLLWWYGGVIAPVLAWLIAVAWLPDSPPPRRPE